MDRLLKKIEHKNLTRALMRNKSSIIGRQQTHQNEHLSRNKVRNSLSKNSLSVSMKLNYLKAIEDINKSKNEDFSQALTLLNHKLNYLDEKNKVPKKAVNKKLKIIKLKKRSPKEKTMNIESSKTINCATNDIKNDSSSMLPNLVNLLNPSTKKVAKVKKLRKVRLSQINNESSTPSLPRLSVSSQSGISMASSQHESAKNISLLADKKEITKSLFAKPAFNSDSDPSSEEGDVAPKNSLGKPKWLEISQETLESHHNSSFNGTCWIKDSKIFKEAIRHKMTQLSKLRPASRNNICSLKPKNATMNLNRSMILGPKRALAVAKN
ncbi:unnamed protein product [Moneuplotes crassus]|uniref:Uncharacterized protein n=1 Tax=Euplotes crassus TaxID=5936 RepID=A0AAD1U6Z4_EUPCR|nr:unnamed protein product [Moneuplotes crassus]